MRRPRRAPRRIRKLSHPRWAKRKIHAATVWCEPSLIRGEVLLGFNKLPDTDGKKLSTGPLERSTLVHRLIRSSCTSKSSDASRLGFLTIDSSARSSMKLSGRGPRLNAAS